MAPWLGPPPVLWVPEKPAIIRPEILKPSIFPFIPPVGAGKVSVVATGGSINTVAGYRIHTFWSAGTFTIVSGPASIPVDYFILAGGAGGGAANTTGSCAGGGGAGGLLQGTVSLGPGSWAVAVGMGGAGGIAGTTWYGQNGGNSSIFSVTATGGGGGSHTYWDGALYYGGAGLGGGCGGGTGYNNVGYGYGAGIPGQGGNGMEWNNGGLGGGGGGCIQNAPSYAGGAGILSSFSGTATYYGYGGSSDTAVTTPPYYGSGGGGGIGTVSYSGAGGQQGVVMVRYPYP